MSARKKPELVAAELVEGSPPGIDPEPLVRLRAALYESERGGLVIAFRVEGTGHDSHMVIGPQLLKLLARGRGIKGDPVAVLKQGLGSLTARVPERELLDEQAVAKAVAEGERRAIDEAS